MVSCFFFLFASYFKLLYFSWTAQEKLCCALSSADSGKHQLCCSSVSNMFLKRFKNSTVWNISIFSLLEENWGGVNSLLLYWSKMLYSVQTLHGLNKLLVLAEAMRQECLVGAWAQGGPWHCQGCWQSWHVWQLCQCRTVGLDVQMLNCLSAAFTACSEGFPTSACTATWRWSCQSSSLWTTPTHARV